MMTSGVGDGMKMNANTYHPLSFAFLFVFAGCYSGDRDVRGFDGSKTIVVDVRSQEINIAHQIQPENSRLPAAAETTEINTIKAIDQAQQKQLAKNEIVEQKKPADPIKDIKAEQAIALKVEQSKAIEKIKESHVAAKYEVRVGLFKIKSNADQLMTKLQDLGLQAQAVTKDSAQHGVVTHITLLPVGDESEAERQKALLKEKLQISASVKKLKN